MAAAISVLTAWPSAERYRNKLHKINSNHIHSLQTGSWWLGENNSHCTLGYSSPQGSSQ